MIGLVFVYNKAANTLLDDIAGKIEAEARKEFDEAVDFAMNSPEPDPESAFEGIYADEGGN